MHNPSTATRRAEAQNEAFTAHIVPLAQALAQDPAERSPLPPNGFPERSPKQTQITPVLPEHLEKLLDSPWSPEASRQIDLWLWYIEREFELTGGAR